MFARAALFAVLCTLATASAAFAKAPLTKRQDLGSIINSLTSDAGAVFTDVTSGAGSIFTDATSGAGSVFTQVTSGAGSLASEATSVGANIATSITSIGGQAATIVTSAGGQAITLATSGVITTFAGSVYTAVSPSAASSSVNPQLVLAFAAVFSSMMLGALLAL